MSPKRSHTRLTSISWIVGFLLLSFASHNLRASELYFIDAHSQVGHKLKNLEQVIDRMDKGGVYRTILSARSNRTSAEIVSLAKVYPGRILPALRVKSKTYGHNHPKYYKQLRKQVQSGHFKAMAEVLMYHAKKGAKAPEVVVYPEDQRVQTTLRAAIENGWPFILHIEFQALKGEKRQRFMTGMQNLLKANSAHPFALNHMGQLTPAEVRSLIENHGNLYFLTAHTNPVITRHSNQPWVNMFQGAVIAKEWKDLLIQHVDRFIFAMDNVWEDHWEEIYVQQMEYWRKAMADLPGPVAHAIAHGNAEHLWGIQPKSAGIKP